MATGSLQYRTFCGGAWTLHSQVQYGYMDLTLFSNVFVHGPYTVEPCVVIWTLTVNMVRVHYTLDCDVCTWT